MIAQVFNYTITMFQTRCDSASVQLHYNYEEQDSLPGSRCRLPRRAGNIGMVYTWFHLVIYIIYRFLVQDMDKTVVLKGLLCVLVLWYKIKGHIFENLYLLQTPLSKEIIYNIYTNCQLIEVMLRYQNINFDAPIMFLHMKRNVIKEVIKLHVYSWQ